MAVVAAPKGGYQTGGWYWDPQAGNARQYTGSGFGNPGQVVVGGNNNQPSQPSGPSSADVDNAFNPTFSALDKMTSDLSNLGAKNDQNIDQTYADQSKLIPGYQTSMQNTLQQSENTYNQAHKSAYEGALDKYQALQQRNMALYGGSNSAGEAGNELLGRAFLQGQDQLQAQDASAQLAFQGQNQDITNWVSNTSAQLDSWKRDAHQQNQQELMQALAQVNLIRGQTETQKNAMKMGLINQAQQNAIALDNLHTQLTNQLQVAQALQINPLNQAAFQQGIVQQAGQLPGVTTSPFSSATAQTGPAAPQAPSFQGGPISTNYRDPFSALG